jgi:arylsulfatase A-like enzyme
MRKVILYPATILATGFVYGLLEGVLALVAKPGGVNPAYNLVQSLIHRCLFYTVLLAVVGGAVLLTAAAVAAVRRKRSPSPSRAAAAGMLGWALAANIFWTAVAVLKLKKFVLWGRGFNVWEPAGFFIFLFGPGVLLIIVAGVVAYKVLGKLNRPGRVAAVAAAAALAGWVVLITAVIIQTAAKPKPDANYPDVVFITLDAWRADAFGPGDHKKTLTPNIDRFAENAYVFRYARSQASWTLPTFATIFTSQYPAVHDARTEKPLGTNQPTVAEILSSRGYDTRAVVANELCLPFTGVTRGFRDYHYWNTVGWLKAIGYYDTNFFFPAFRKGREEKSDSRITTVLTEATLNRLERRGGRPFFLWLHYLDPHGPYWPPPAYADPSVLEPVKGRGLTKAERGAILRARYDGEVRYVDDELGRILRVLERRPNTIVIISSDHGEEFLEHRGLDHGHTVYEELLRVPLIVKLPGFGGGYVNMPVDAIDLAPTVLDYLGLEIPASMQGRTLIPAILGEGYERPSFAGPTQLKGSKKEAVYYKGKKFVYDYKYPSAGAWYDLTADPGERSPRPPTDPEAVELWDFLQGWRKANRDLRDDYRNAGEDGAIRDAMKTMGYVK